jgi:hypothetical protein
VALLIVVDRDDKGDAAVAARGRPRPRWFRQALRWRTGCEGRVSVLKHRHGLGGDGTSPIADDAAKTIGLGQFSPIATTGNQRRSGLAFGRPSFGLSDCVLAPDPTMILPKLACALAPP